MTDLTPQLTRAERELLPRYAEAVERWLKCPLSRYEAMHEKMVLARAAAVAAIRAAERERVLRSMIERIDQKLELRTCQWDECRCDECGLVHDLRLDLSVSIEKLRGEGAR